MNEEPMLSWRDVMYVWCIQAVSSVLYQGIKYLLEGKTSWQTSEMFLVVSLISLISTKFILDVRAERAKKRKPH